ncbi:MAG: GNAT family N-acetyltransferase [Spirochaetales bacterium]|nr:GNAT family N-acetyltransferase [Spirochaetales bacterium]
MTAALRFKPYTSADWRLVLDFLVDSFARTGRPFNWFVDRWCFTTALGPAFHGHSRAGQEARIGLWTDDSGRLMAMADEEEGKGDVFLQFLEPSVATPELVAEMLDFAERACVRPRDGAPGFALRIPESLPWVAALALERGYARAEWTEPMSRRPLEAAPAIPSLPEGLRLADGRETTGTTRADAHRRAFGYDDPGYVARGPAAFAAVRESPLWRAELDAAVLDPDGREVSFACGWYDGRNRLVVLEPVGTDPAFRRKGLADAAIALVLSRAFALGARSAWVGSDQAFYRAIGFEVAHRYAVYEYRETRAP